MSRQSTETDLAKRASLKRIEARLLLELGQREQAVAAAASLAALDTCSAASAFLADILARAEKWRMAEAEFGRARLLAEQEGNGTRAHKLAAGPLFLLAEARGDHGRCAEIAPFPLLANRARRLMGHTVEGTCADSLEAPWRELALLEEAHRTGNPGVLRDVLEHWKAGEAEWRWRILYEGAMLFSQKQLSMKQWKRYFAATGKTVLDPRYPSERKLLRKLL